MSLALERLGLRVGADSATTLTASNALPFAAVMTRSYSASGMD